MQVFEIENLQIQYGSKTAVLDLNLKLEQGKCLALLGLNGAGKSSTIKGLLGMVRPKQGKISLLGEAPGSVAAFSRLGFAPEEASPPEFLTGREYLRFVAGFRMGSGAQIKTLVEQKLDFFELEPKKKISAYSKGMKRRILLAQALMGDPALLILDEPLSGLDPIFIRKLRESITSFCSNGGSVLFSSHILAEVEKTCQQVAIIHEGKLVESSSCADLVATHGSIENAFTNKVGHP